MSQVWAGMDTHGMQRGKKPRSPYNSTTVLRYVAMNMAANTIINLLRGRARQVAPGLSGRTGEAGVAGEEECAVQAQKKCYIGMVHGKMQVACCPGAGRAARCGACARADAVGEQFPVL